MLGAKELNVVERVSLVNSKELVQQPRNPCLNSGTKSRSELDY